LVQTGKGERKYIRVLDKCDMLFRIMNGPIQNNERAPFGKLDIDNNTNKDNYTNDNKVALSLIFEREIQTNNLKEKEKFISYWTEKNIKGTKERWQMEKTFDIKRRWKKWTDNCKEWGIEEKKKPYYFDFPLVKKDGKWFAIDDGIWKNFAGDEKDIIWK
jgi:hypothetical protein